MRRFLSLRSKIFLYIFIFMAIPIIVITYIANKISANSLLEQTRINDLQTIGCLQESTDTLLDSVESLSGIIARDQSVKDYLSASYSLAHEQPEAYASLDFGILAAPYLSSADFLLGASLLNTDCAFVGEQKYNKNQLSWHFNRSLLSGCEKDRFTWTSPHMLVDSKTNALSWAVSCVTPVYQEDTLLGYLAVYMDRSRLDKITKNLSDNVYIINDAELSSDTKAVLQECYIISDKTYSSSDFNPYTASFYYKSKINYNYLVNNSSIITSSNGQKVTVTSQKYPRMGWVYLIVSPFSNINQLVLSHLSQIFITCVACIVFALVSAYSISRIITRPIFSLNKTMEKVKNGNLEVRQENIPNDEIGMLGQTFNSLLDKISELMNNIKEQQKNKRKLQLQLIQAQVKPHFLYNVLEMVNSFIRDHMDDYALNSIAHLANFYRTSLSDGHDIISIGREVNMTENYLSLQQLRYIEFMEFSLDVADEISACQIPKLTLQPLVENAIYHGLKTKCEKGELKVTGYLKDKRIFFEIYDSGAGMDCDTITSIYDSLKEERLTKDFGISNIVKRLNIHFNNKAEIEIHSEPGKYSLFILSFPAVEL